MNTFLFFRAWFYTGVVFLTSYATIYIFFHSTKVTKVATTKMFARRRRLWNFLDLVRIYYFYPVFSCSSLCSATAVNQKLIPSQRWWVAGYANRWRIADWPQSYFGLEMKYKSPCLALSSSISKTKKKVEYFWGNKNIGLCPADNSTELWIMTAKIPGRFLLRIPTTRARVWASTKKSCPNFATVELLST